MFHKKEQVGERRDRRILSIKLETITPEKAAKILERNPSNRKLSWSLVQTYANDMKRGAWLVTHQGMAINQAGEVMDGQHRLWAIVESGCPIECYVAIYEGQESAMMWPFDKGKGRTTTDTTGIPSREVAVVKEIVRTVYGIQVVLPDDLIARLHDRLKPHIDAVEDNHVRALSIAPVRAAVALRHACGVDWTQQYGIIIHRRHSEMVGMTDALYKKLIEGSIVHGGTASKMKFAMTWHASDPTRKNQKTFRSSYLEEAIEEATVNFKKFAPDIAGEVDGLVRHNVKKMPASKKR